MRYNEEPKAVWETLSKTDVTKQVELKKNFSYLSWAWAWAYLKNIYPDATFEKHTFRDNQDNPLPFMRDTKGHTYVAVSVTIKGLTHTEIHYVMGNKNESLTHPTGAEVNKALQRCLVKAIAFHGLGLSLYAGEDLPLETEDDYDDIIDQFNNAADVEDLDSCWVSNKTRIGGLSQTSKQRVTNAFKEAKNKLKLKIKVS